MSRIRAPAVAGSFYPDDPQTLMATVDRLLAEAAETGEGLRPAPKALIVPHAGYIYSGAVAAKGYRLLMPLKGRIRRVVLVGPVHHHWISGIAVPEVEAFDTPIGALPVDSDAVLTLATLPQVVFDDAPHATEHSLEVQLPFVLRVLGEVAIVPLLVGDASPKDVAEVLARLWGGPETLIVVSSDLSHDQSYLAARRLDTATAMEIETLQVGALGGGHACGCLPINGLLAEAKDRHLQVQRLDLCNSGDTAGARNQVVGYGAWAFRAAA